ncbi:MAG: serine/threonine protein kinase [Deltaproteobacteria bacterium]|nr:serine/threonine protein kinase [Deltaproteobacteria bacterium]
MSRPQAASDETQHGNDAGAPTPLPGARMGRYVVIDTLGEGAMGVVLRAFDTRLERTVAIKLIRPSHGPRDERARARLVAEARALARLAHPNIVAVYEVDLHESQIYVAMELVEGIDLQRWLREQTRAWREVVALFVPLAEGLAAVHEAGIVHRDFKPANVLVGDDGRARIGDFGIARRSLDGERSLSDTPSLDDAEPHDDELVDIAVDSLTAEGRVVGTPAYMAPEQHAGAEVGPAADQYAFAVSLWEALYGKRPFSQEVRRLAAAKQHPPRSPPPGSNVPRWLFVILARALSPDPAARFPSMAALASALRRDRGRRRRRIAFATATAAGVVAGAALMAAREGPCGGAESQLDGIWDDAAREATAVAFAASTRPWARPSWERARTVLDDYAARWIAGHRDACEATRVRGEQSSTLLDQRMACLATRRDGLAAAVELVRAGEDDVIDRAVLVVERLRDLDSCADTTAMASAVALPDDAALREAVRAVRSDVERIRVAHNAGRNLDALALADTTLATARALAYEPAIAEMLQVDGDVLEALGHVAEARAAYQESVYGALGLALDEVATDAAAGLVWIASERDRDFDEAMRWSALAHATLRRAGSPPRLAARLGNVTGAAYSTFGHAEQAQAEFDAALARIADRDDERVLAFSIGSNVGKLHHDAGDLAGARAHYERVLADITATLGGDHPLATRTRGALAAVADAMGDHDYAIAQLESVRAAFAAAFGPDSTDVGAALINLALAHDRAHHRDEALALHLRALEIFERAGDRLEISSCLINLGDAYYERGVLDAALAHFERALTMLHELYGDTHPDLVLPMIGVGRVWITQGRFEDALAQFDRVQALATKLDPDLRAAGAGIEGRTEALQKLGRLDEALASARQQVAFYQRIPSALPNDVPIARGYEAGVLLAMSRFADAIAVIELALGEALAIHDPELEAELELQHARALLELHRRDEAGAALERATVAARRADHDGYLAIALAASEAIAAGRAPRWEMP